MKLRSLLLVASWFFCSGLSLRGQQPAPTTAITLRAFFNMIDEPAAVAEGFIRWTNPARPEEELAEMRLVIPPAIVAHWIDIAAALQAGLPVADRVEIFPPGLREALQDTDEVPLKRDVLQPLLARVRDAGAAQATPGAAPEVRLISVPTGWLDSYWKARDQFARKMSDAFVEATKDEPLIVRNERGTFFRGSGKNLIRVADPDVRVDGPVYCAPYGKKGTWNLYQVINRPATWLQADKAARALTAPIGEKKIAGHLASIHSKAENQFIRGLIDGVSHAWIGLNDRRLEAFRDKDGTWEWSSGEPVTFRNFNVGEPNNANTPHNGGDEDGVVMDRNENNQHPPGIWTDFGDGSRVGYNSRYPYIVEWSVEADGPIAGAAALPNFFSERLPCPEGRDGSFGMRIVYGAGVCGSLEKAREVFVSGGGRVVDTRVSTLNHRDPDQPHYGVLFPGAQPFPEQVEKEADRDFAYLCRGRIRVPAAGIYTFGVIHDDGFAMRIGDHRWRRASGFGTISPGNPVTLEHRFTAGNGLTLGTIELPAGDHELDFFGFQREGGGYVQLFSAKGEFTNLHETRDWRLVGHLGAGEIGIPGIAAPGWQVEITVPGKLVRNTFDGAQRALERHGRKLEAPAAIVDYMDPDDGSDLRLEGAQPFPDSVPKQQDNDFAVRARGVLEIPKSGTYWIGYHSMRGGRLTIEGRAWKRLVLAGPGKAVVDDDLIESDVTAENGCRVVGEIELEAGRYPLEFLACFAGGRAAIEITGAHAHGPDVHLKAGEARLVQDVAGLSLVK